VVEVEPSGVIVTSFRVMASATQVILVDAPPGAAAYARRRLEQLEDRWSRFLPDSELSRLNEAPGALLRVSDDTVALLTAMREAHGVTGGRFDPTMLDAIVEVGYTLSVDGSGRRSLPRAARRSHRSHARRDGMTVLDVEVDHELSAVVMPAGLGLDPGGIGKGLAADLVVTELLAGGTGGALVCVGGDLAAAGTPPAAGGWPVTATDPFDAARSIASFAIEGGGVATSSTRSRAWTKSGVRRHHALDPDTLTSAETDLATATVVARAGWEAEAHATAALLCGSDRVLDYLARRGLDGLAVTLDGAVLASPALPDAVIPERSVA
jgi:thiamine biosynthesis lipoprotein